MNFIYSWGMCRNIGNAINKFEQHVQKLQIFHIWNYRLNTRVRAFVVIVAVPCGTIVRQFHFRKRIKMWTRNKSDSIGLELAARPLKLFFLLFFGIVENSSSKTMTIPMTFRSYSAKTFSSIYLLSRMSGYWILLLQWRIVGKKCLKKKTNTRETNNWKILKCTSSFKIFLFSC